jgi:hypothetical protein
MSGDLPRNIPSWTLALLSSWTASVNDFLSEGGKLWPKVEAVATSVNLIGNRRAVAPHNGHPFSWRRSR